MKENKQNNEDFTLLAKELWDRVYTQVPVEALLSLNLLKDDIIKNEIDGDIVECGAWRGGCVIYLANIFSDKTIWAIDSFEGFQKVGDSDYPVFENEVHTPDIHKKLDGSIYIRGAKSFVITQDEFIENLKTYGLDNNKRIKIIKGFVNKVLKPNVCKIEKISLLRVDVDAYSATKEVLVNLYDKVSVGGYIVFDDYGVPSAERAIHDFMNDRKIKLNLEFPINGKTEYAIFKKTDI